MKKRLPILKIIILLLITIGIFTIYASLPEAVDIGGPIKQSKMDEYFITPPNDNPVFLNKISYEIPLIFEEEEKKRAKIDSSAQKILLAGDSMTEGLKFAFTRYAKFNGHELKTVTWYSSSTEWWSESDSLRKLIELYQPTYILFTTGSNELFVRDLEKRDLYIENIVSQAGKTKFIWIGPPNWTEDTGINDLIEKHTGSDRYFASKNMTFTRASDGAHPTWNSARHWADSISSWVMIEARDKILLQKPPPDFDLANKK